MSDNGKHVTKNLSAAEHRARKHAAQERKRRKAGRFGGQTNLFQEVRSDKRHLVAEATMAALEEKLAHSFDRFVAKRGCDLYAAGKRLPEIFAELQKEFAETGKVGIRAFKAEVTYQMGRSQAELVMA